MKKKIYALSCIMLFLLCAIPTCNSQEPGKNTALNTTIFAHVIIKGNGTAYLIHNNFTSGFGRCWVMIFNLKADGYVAINKLFDQSNITVMDGSRVVILIGFIGVYSDLNGIKLNGIALIAAW